MEAQVESTTSSSAKPQSIVEQLLEIAKKYDAMDMIGGSTSWRWQEGLITRMPKTRTVAAILTKAFNSDDPNVWLESVDGTDLRTFIVSSFDCLSFNEIDYSEYIRDIYDSLFVILAAKDDGISKDELIYNFAYFKYASSFDENEYFETPRESALFQMYGKWAVSKLSKILENKKVYDCVDGKYKIAPRFTSSEIHSQNYLEISRLRSRMVGFSSEHDMWRHFSVEMSDREHIYFEKKMLSFYKEFFEEVELVSNTVKNEDRKIRNFNFSSITIPAMSWEGLL